MPPPSAAKPLAAIRSFTRLSVRNHAPSTRLSTVKYTMATLIVSITRLQASDLVTELNPPKVEYRINR